MMENKQSKLSGSDWLNELERNGWRWKICPGCRNSTLVSPEGETICPVCNPEFLQLQVTEHTASEGGKA